MARRCMARGPRGSGSWGGRPASRRQRARRCLGPSTRAAPAGLSAASASGRGRSAPGGVARPLGRRRLRPGFPRAAPTACHSGSFQRSSAKPGHREGGGRRRLRTKLPSARANPRSRGGSGGGSAKMEMGLEARFQVLGDWHLPR